MKNYHSFWYVNVFFIQIERTLRTLYFLASNVKFSFHNVRIGIAAISVQSNISLCLAISLSDLIYSNFLSLSHFWSRYNEKGSNLLRIVLEYQIFQKMNWFSEKENFSRFRLVREKILAIGWKSWTSFPWVSFFLKRGEIGRTYFSTAKWKIAKLSRRYIPRSLKKS